MKVNQKKLLVSLACLLSLICLVGTASANLVVNGSFEAGNTGFSSGYGYVNFASATGPNYPASSLWNEGYYAVGANANLYHVSWYSVVPQDLSNMMIVNGDPTANVIVWKQTVPVVVTPNTLYNFSAWVASNYPSNAAVLDFSVNTVALGVPITPSLTPGVWSQFTATWNSGLNTTAELSLINLNTVLDGNDFSLDNIQFDRTNPVPLPPTALLLGSGLLGLGLLRRKWSLKK